LIKEIIILVKEEMTFIAKWPAWLETWIAVRLVFLNSCMFNYDTITLNHVANG